jgi:8-oxo-dGTP diphosphatase
MWWILVLLTGSLGLYLVIILFLFLFLSGASWQEWLILGIFIVVYLLANKNSTNPEVAKSRRERKMEKKARKEQRKQYAIQKEEERLRNMNHIRVVAAVIHDDKDRIFVTQRGYGDMKGKWEFPGGKIEPDETREEALKREIREELAAEITIERYLEKVEWNYPKFRLTMYCYLCKLDSGYTLKEHSAAKWLKRNERLTVDWLPADRALFMKTTF